MEDKTCAKKIFKNPSNVGMNQTRIQFFLFEKIIAFNLLCGVKKTPSVPFITVSFWYCRIPCFNVYFSFLCEPSVPETAEICGSSQCQNVYNNKFTKFGGFKGSNLSVNSTYSSILAEANVGYFILPLMANINCDVNNGS